MMRGYVVSPDNDNLQRATLPPVPEQHYTQHEDSANESGLPQGSKARGEANSTRHGTDFSEQEIKQAIILMIKAGEIPPPV